MWLNGLLAAALAVSVVTDIRTRKIYNKLLFPAAAAALALHLAESGWGGLVSGLAGLAAGMGILLLPYLAGGMGAGDVKLLGLVGLCKGAAFVWVAALYMALAGGVMAVMFLLFRKGALGKLKWAAIVAYSLRYGVRLPLTAGRNADAAGLPYGVAIAAGALLSVWGSGWLT